MRVFVTGGTGFTGSRVVPLLLKNGNRVHCLYRPTSDRSILPHPEIEWVVGDLSDSSSLASAMHRMDILVNIASIGFGHAENILKAAQTAGIQRAIFISTTAIFTRLNAESKHIRLAAEHAIQTSSLDFTILRPTMIYGSPRDRNMWRLIRFMRSYPIVPVFGNGNSLQQPVYMDDVAEAVVNSLANDRTIYKSYNIAGKHPLTYNKVIEVIAEKLDKQVWKLNLPSKPFVTLLRFFERLHIPAPIKAEQVLRLNENKSFRYEEAHADFGFSPISFEDGIDRELRISADI